MHPALRDEVAELLLARLDIGWGVSALGIVFSRRDLADAAACHAWWARQER